MVIKHLDVDGYSLQLLLSVDMNVGYTPNYMTGGNEYTDKFSSGITGKNFMYEGSEILFSKEELSAIEDFVIKNPQLRDSMLI